MPDRPRVAFVAWTAVSGRSAEIASALDGDARSYYDTRLARRALVPLRWASAAARMIAYLIRHRPRAVIATNPPLIPGLIALAYGRLARAPLLLDSHPTAFGRKDHAVAKRLLPLHAWVARRARSNLVASEGLGEHARAWGARADVIHEAPLDWSAPPPARLDGRRPRVLFVGIFASDEPIDAVVDAAKLAPELDLHVTGDLRRCPPGPRERAPGNVEFVGFLRDADYRRELEAADIVLALTTEPTSVVRAGYEAVYAGRPLVVSDWPLLRETFPHAEFTPHDAEGLAAAVRRAASRHSELVASAPRALELQRSRWEEQLATLRKLIGSSPRPAEAGA